MKYLLRFECIGDGAPHSLALQKLGLMGPRRYWVYRLSLNGGRLERLWMKHMKDYSESNSVGTRGVYAEYILEDGQYYEVKQPLSWKRFDLYYCTVNAQDGALIRLTREEVVRCLESARSG